MENYVVIKRLPDANVGTEVIWDKTNNCYYYKKSGWVSPNDKTYLTAGQVTQNTLFFTKLDEYPEHYAYKYPVYSREEILDLFKKHLAYKSISTGEFDLSITKEMQRLKSDLRELGKVNAKKILNENIRN